MTDEPSNEIVEVSRAVTESAVAAQKALEVVRSTGGFADRVFGDLVTDSVGVIADKIKHYRFRNYVKLSEETMKILRSRGCSEDGATKPVPPKIAIPLIENATIEDDDELRKLWASLLANPADPKFEVDVKLRHVSLLREMEPLDVRILNACYVEKQSNFRNIAPGEVQFKMDQIAKSFGVADDRVELALLNLIRLSCVDPGYLPGPMAMNVGGRSRNQTVYVGTEVFTLTSLGIELCKAAALFVA